MSCRDYLPQFCACFGSCAKEQEQEQAPGWLLVQQKQQQQEEGQLAKPRWPSSARLQDTQPHFWQPDEPRRGHRRSSSRSGRLQQLASPLFDSPQGSSGTSSPGEQYLRYGDKLTRRKHAMQPANPLLTDSAPLESSLIPPGQLHSRGSSHRRCAPACVSTHECRAAGANASCCRRRSSPTTAQLYSTGAVSIGQRADLTRTSPLGSLQESGGPHSLQHLLGGLHGPSRPLYSLPAWVRAAGPRAQPAVPVMPAGSRSLHGRS